MRLLQYGDQITQVRILTCSDTHCLLLSVGVGDVVAIKSGFGSGYQGEGSHAFSYVLQLLEAHAARIDEYEVPPEIIERVDSSSLTTSDIDHLEGAKPVRPTRWHGYVFEEHWENERNGTLWEEFPPVIPFAIIDNRITDLALSFWDGPDDRLITGYRRLEDIVRNRIGVHEHGAKLFSQAFVGQKAKLGWKDIDSGEQGGRGSLFTAAYSAYRNRRAHRELKDYANDQLAEFLLLNHLYILEAASSERGSEEPDSAGASPHSDAT